MQHSSWPSCADLPELHTLRLSGNIFRDSRQPAFFPGLLGSKCSSLQSLEMRSCFMQAVPPALSDLTALTALDLSGNRFLELERSDVDVFRRLSRLRELVSCWAGQQWHCYRGCKRRAAVDAPQLIALCCDVHVMPKSRPHPTHTLAAAALPPNRSAWPSLQACAARRFSGHRLRWWRWQLCSAPATGWIWQVHWRPSRAQRRCETAWLWLRHCRAVAAAACPRRRKAPGPWVHRRRCSVANPPLLMYSSLNLCQ